MVTDNSITSMAYNEKDNPNFENSYADQWLNQEFLPTLHDYEDYLVVNSTWDVTEDSRTEPTRLGENTIKRTVGLLTAYEFYTTYNNSDGLATYMTGYLTKRMYWWLITPFSPIQVTSISHTGGLVETIPTDGRGIRPAVNLQTDIEIVSGVGTKDNPYILSKNSNNIA